MWCSIAQMGSNRSSNAGVASGIAMHTWIRQHALGAPPRNRALPTPSVALAHEHAAKPHARDRALPAKRALPTPSVALVHDHVGACGGRGGAGGLGGGWGAARPLRLAGSEAARHATECSKAADRAGRHAGCASRQRAVALLS